VQEHDILPSESWHGSEEEEEKRKSGPMWNNILISYMKSLNSAILSYLDNVYELG
jgi:hypothetical protein